MCILYCSPLTLTIIPRNLKKKKIKLNLITNRCVKKKIQFNKNGIHVNSDRYVVILFLIINIKNFFLSCISKQKS